MKAKTAVLYLVDDTDSKDKPVKVFSREYRGDSIKDCEILLQGVMRLGEEVEDFFGEHEIDILAQNNWQVLRVGRYVRNNNDKRFFALLKYVYKNGNIIYRLIGFDGTRKQFLDRSALINECEHDLQLIADVSGRRSLNFDATERIRSRFCKR